MKSLNIRLTKTINLRTKKKRGEERNQTVFETFTKIFYRVYHVKLRDGFSYFDWGWKYIWEEDHASSGFGRGLGIACKSHVFALQSSLRS